MFSNFFLIHSLLLVSVLVPAEENKVPDNVQAILQREHSLIPKKDCWSIVIPRAHDLYDALYHKYSNSQAIIDPEYVARERYLTTLARIYQEGRVLLAKRAGTGVLTIDIARIIAASAADPVLLSESAVVVEVDPADSYKAIAHVVAINQVDARVFEKQILEDIAGNTCAVIGIGGGSDCIQATQLASILPADKKVSALISVRTAKPSSSGASGNMEEARLVSNAQLIEKGVYKLSPESTGTGRFFENLPAQLYPTYLVIDENKSALLVKRLEAALAHAGGCETIIAVDTGGDALFPVKNAVDQQGHSTPDQDLRVLQALQHFEGSHTIYTAEIAVGVDSPANAQDILQAAHARYYQLSATQVEQILERYRFWGMDGSDEARYGKTSLTWQAALSGKEGLYVLPLPQRVVCDMKNPWIPFVLVQKSMAGIFVSTLRNHLQAIGAISSPCNY